MKAIILTGVVAMLVAVSAGADCMEPIALNQVPNGASASRDEMLAAQRAIKSYENAVTAYVACLEQTHASPGTENAVLEKLQKLAERFNKELQAFKARNGAK